MGLKKNDLKFQELNEACSKIWEWLRTFSAYEKAFKAQAQNKLSVSDARKIWIFYPLINPRREKLPAEAAFLLLDFLGERTGLLPEPEPFRVRKLPIKESDFFPSKQDFIYNPYPQYAKSFDLPGKTFFLEVFPYREPDRIAEEFKALVKRWQKENNIKPKRPRAGDGVRIYKAHVMMSLNCFEKDARKQLANDMGKTDRKGAQVASTRAKAYQAIRSVGRFKCR